tara:strand:- start:13470 stop:14402 length:933 start_codon:yes stop_codon:yes gene_type:complete
MTTFVFPGQGSQYLGMAKDFFDNFDVAKDIFTEIEDTSKINLKKILFGNDVNLLNQTNFTQISIFCTSIIIFKTIDKLFGLDKFNIKCMLGHSLGEYTALTASGSLNIAQTSYLLKLRGELMNTALEPNKSSMAALIGTDSETVEKIIKNNNIDVEIANDNSPIQVVVSGLKNQIDNSQDIFLSNGVKKFVVLNVSAAFHSKLMIEAQEIFKKEINKMNFNNSICPIVSNYDGLVNSEIETIVSNLKSQMANRVRWTESIISLEKLGENKVIEIGPGKVLSGLIKRISNNFDIITVNNINDIEKLNNNEF